MLENVRAATDKPLCVGFGVSTPAHVAQIAGIADGVVIGSALVDFLHKHSGNGEADVRELVRAWKAATRRDGWEQA